MRPVALSPALSLRGVEMEVPGRNETIMTTLPATDVDVGAGEFVCLTGRSGAGKTTALQLAIGLHPPTRGRIAWQGEQLDYSDGESLARRRNTLVGYVDQSATLLPGLTLLENVLLAAVPAHAVESKRREARLLLRELGLHDRASHTSGQLSGGEAQRGAIARALLMNPAILIADEPTASLDLENARIAIAMLRNRARNGAAVLVASHDPLVHDSADRLHALGTQGT